MRNVLRALTRGARGQSALALLYGVRECGGDVGGREISGVRLRGLPLQNGVSVLKPVGARAGSSPLWGGVGRALVPRASSLARPTPQDVNESGSH